MPPIRMLGALELRDPAGPVVTPVRRKQRTLLGLMLVRAGTVVSTDEIGECLWAGRPPSSARANLHSYVWGLRTLLGGRPRRTDTGYLLELGPQECDATVFERLADDGRRELEAGRAGSAAARLTEALSLWRGPVLDGQERTDWLAPAAARLEEARLVAMEQQAQARLALGQLGGLAVELTDATTRYPLRERLWGHLMVALHRTGRHAEALDAYGRLHELLDRELGTRPGPALRHLHRQIREGA